MKGKKTLKIRISKDHQDYYYEKRAKFQVDRHFIVSILGFAIGCKMVLRFPQIVYQNGGITFLIPYIILMFILVIPVTYLEIALGQINQDGFSVILERQHPKYRGFGQIGAIMCFNIATYYNLQIVYSLVYIYQLFATKIQIKSILQAQDVFLTQILEKNDSNSLIQINSSILVAYLISIVALFLLIKDGVRGSGKIMQYTFTTPLFLLLVLLLKAVTLEGSWDGLCQLLKPDMKNLINPFIWADAAFNLLLQMSVGFGVLSQYASHRQQNFPILPISLWGPLITFGLTMITTAIVFCYLGHASFLLKQPIKDLMMNDWDLGFVFFPYIFSQLYGGQTLMIIFFTTIILLGIDSMVGFIQNTAGTIEDCYFGTMKIFNVQINGIRLRLILCIALALSGVLYSSREGYELSKFMELFTTLIPFIQFLLFEVFYFCTPFQIRKLNVTMQRNGMPPIPLFIKFCLTYISHICVIVISLFCIISQIEQTIEYSWIAIILGWIISLCPLIYAVQVYRKYQFIHFNKTSDRIFTYSKKVIRTTVAKIMYNNLNV